ncbi:Protein TusB [Candidatus Hartigia pinicola]|nr:Protein TusB [Candidatus Hartigia pinicola]
MLYIISTSPFQCDFRFILRLITPRDTILLIQDGVIAVISQSMHFRSLYEKGAKIYVLNEDVNARGLQNMISEQVILASYEDFVWLTANHKQQFSL